MEFWVIREMATFPPRTNQVTCNLKKMLMEFYKVDTETKLKLACEADWRFVIPKDIATEGFLPRTPFVCLEKDPNWISIDKLEERLLEVVNEKKAAQKKVNHPPTRRS